MPILALLTFLLDLIVLGESTLTYVVKTDKGPVVGDIRTTVENELNFAAFLGIPYAEPPVGSLRFQPPAEKKAWKNILRVTSEGSMCIQYNRTSSTVVGSEDCLYLNVFTPHTQFKKYISKPVMVWIHGGSYMTGNSNASYYGPDFLLEEDVVIVSFNYRLGPLGFLNLNHENASGNYGLKDQNLALKWVQRNIANFGGNPKNVTIFGQSAGSVSVDLHILSDMSSGLFSRSISMSGASLCFYWGFQTSLEAKEAAFLLGSKLGTNTLSKDRLLKILINASAADIIKKAHDLPLIPFRPSIESTAVAKNQDKFLTECSLKKYFSGHYNKGSHMMGFTSMEAVAFAGSESYSRIYMNYTFLNQAKNNAYANISAYISAGASILSDIITAVLSSIKNAFLSIHLSSVSKTLALSTDAISNLSTAALYKLLKELSDLLFVTGIDSKQKLLRLHNKYPIYYYRFSFDSNYSAHRTNGVDLDGVGHEDELPYVFYRPQVKLPLDQPDIKVTRMRMVRLWTNFAKYGNPTPDGSRDSILGVTWPDSRILGRHLEINKLLTVGRRPTDVSVRAFKAVGLGASPILNDCFKKNRI